MNKENSSIVSPRQTLAETFAALHQKRQMGLMPFIPAGYPDLATTRAMLPALEKGGANIIEIGFPFSDPIADGPTIQEAFTAALAKKIHLKDIFQSIAATRNEIAIPLVAMVSYSLVFRYGVDRFLSEAKTAGFDGLILPDLPPPEAQAICKKIRQAGLDTILLVAPTTAPDRRKEIADLCSGFVYYLSVAGITGERDRLPTDIAENVTSLRKLTDRPICVGFGVSKTEHIAQLATIADGAIVGSAIVRQIKQHESEEPEKIARVVGEYCRELLGNRA